MSSEARRLPEWLHRYIGPLVLLGAPFMALMNVEALASLRYFYVAALFMAGGIALAALPGKALCDLKFIRHEDTRRFLLPYWPQPVLAASMFYGGLMIYALMADNPRAAVTKAGLRWTQADFATVLRDRQTSLANAYLRGGMKLSPELAAEFLTHHFEPASARLMTAQNVVGSADQCRPVIADLMAAARRGVEERRLVRLFCGTAEFRSYVDRLVDAERAAITERRRSNAVLLDLRRRCADELTAKYTPQSFANAASRFSISPSTRLVTGEELALSRMLQALTSTAGRGEALTPLFHRVVTEGCNEAHAIQPVDERRLEQMMGFRTVLD